MPGRDTSGLYNGRTAGVTVPKRRRQLEEAANEEKLDPKAEAVLFFIAHEKAKVTSIKSIVIDFDTSDEKVYRQLQRQRDQYEFLSNLESKMKRLLGVREPEAEAKSA